MNNNNLCEISLFIFVMVLPSHLLSKEKCGRFDAVRASFEIAGGMDQIVTKLTEVYRIPICLEEAPSFCWDLWLNGSRCDGKTYPTLEVDCLTLTEALDKLTLEIDPRYRWAPWRCKVINVFPKGVDDDPDYLFNEQVGEFQVNEANYFQAIVELGRILRNNRLQDLRVAGTSVVAGATETKKAPQTSERKISLRVRSGTVRDVLNELVAGSRGLAVWHSNDRAEILGGRGAERCGWLSSHAFSVWLGHDEIFASVYSDYPAIEFEPGCRHRPMTAGRPCQWLDRPFFGEIEEQLIEEAVRTLGQRSGIPIHFESATWRCIDGNRACINRNRVTIRGTSLNLRQALDELVSQDNRYTWRAWNCRAVNVYPRRYHDDPYYLMNLNFRFTERAGDTAAELISRLAELLHQRYRLVGIKDVWELDRRPRAILLGWPGDRRSMSLEGMTFREILNELFDQFGGAISWQLHRWLSFPPEGSEQDRWCGQEMHTEIVPVLLE